MSQNPPDEEMDCSYEVYPELEKYFSELAALKRTKDNKDSFVTDVPCIIDDIQRE